MQIFEFGEVPAYAAIPQKRLNFRKSAPDFVA
jgi:hypothetical protein